MTFPVPSDFTIETRDGFRQVAFDPDVYRFKDVRILVDGKRAAGMPYPKPNTPIQEVAFDLDGHTLIAMAYLITGVPLDPFGVAYELFAKGRSLRDGTPIEEVRGRAAKPGKAYPQVFKVIDTTLAITPTAGAPGLVLGLTRNADEMGLPMTVAVVAFSLLALGAATAIARSLWLRIRERDGESVRRRAAIGCGAMLATYATVFVVTIGLILLVRPPT